MKELKVCDDLLDGDDQAFVVAITPTFVIICTGIEGPVRRVRLSHAMAGRERWLAENPQDRVNSVKFQGVHGEEMTARFDGEELEIVDRFGHRDLILIQQVGMELSDEKRTGVQAGDGSFLKSIRDALAAATSALPPVEASEPASTPAPSPAKRPPSPTRGARRESARPRRA